MKKIIYTVIALGVTFDASAMEKQSILGVNGMEERSNFGAIQQVPSQTSSSSIKAFEPAKKRRRKSMDKSKSSVVTRLQEQRHKKTLQEQLDEEAEVNVAFENAQNMVMETPKNGQESRQDLPEGLHFAAGEKDLTILNLRGQVDSLKTQLEKTEADMVALRAEKLEVSKRLKALQTNDEKALQKAQEENAALQSKLDIAVGESTELQQRFVRESETFSRLFITLGIESEFGRTPIEQLEQTIMALKQQNESLRAENEGLQEASKPKVNWFWRLFGY